LMRKAWSTSILFVIASAASATPVPLSALLETAGTAPTVQAAQAEHLATLEDVKARKIESGPKILLSTSTGRYRDLNNINSLGYYYSRNVNAGVQFPLLGTLRKQLDALTKARFDAQRKHFETALRR